MRTDLPNRRRHASTECSWGRYSWKIGVGFDQASHVREVFISGIKVGSDLAATVEDGAVLISRLLQRGDSLADLAKSLGREGPELGTPAASILGITVHMARILELEGP